jgi:hypothetical protein
MPAVRGLLAKFTGNTIGNAAAFAAGGATSRAISPGLQDLTNEAWELHPKVPPDAYALASGVAQGQVDRGKAEKWAAQQGIGTDQFRALVDIANTGPGIANAFELWRRGYIDEAGFRRAVKRIGLEQEWIDDLVQIKTRLLDVADIARGIHRGLIRDPGLMPVEQPTEVGRVPAYPVYGIDALEQAAGHGYSRDELGVLIGLQGNPMGAHEAANATFRGVIEKADYERAIAEGNTRNEWAEAIFEQSRQIPTARDFLENALRGYRTLEDAIAGAAKHGLSAEDATLIYQNQGRPMTVHQITQALARGAKFNPEPGEIRDPYMASIVEGSLKPGYYELEMALRYSYPGFFQTLNALNKGWIDGPTATSWLLYQGYAPEAVDAIVSNVAGTKAGGASTSSQAKSAVTKLYTALHKGFINGTLTAENVRAALHEQGEPADVVDAVLRTWTIEYGLAAIEQANYKREHPSS